MFPKNENNSKSYHELRGIHLYCMNLAIRSVFLCLQSNANGPLSVIWPGIWPINVKPNESKSKQLF